MIFVVRDALWVMAYIVGILTTLLILDWFRLDSVKSSHVIMFSCIWPVLWLFVIILAIATKEDN